ncbi:gamma-glutamylcyclotransferase [candidate division BRC1 bacterium HGW-BRC1-1]|jgi:gamma-glutamylcyclotransferase (GGCT)/AIG2-like uncharacterized protein YtfP|nr:MAG: gamma-glutamylcyclotransferase [candidate division BRC1 bacterium HGW-BRC1-1]
MQKNTNHDDTTESIIRIFVYGTLKRGHANHRLCAHARSIEPAAVWGRLYHLHWGIPRVEVPEETILAQGTDDPLADARAQQRTSEPEFNRPVGDWDLVHGEMVTFADSSRDLPPIDRLEGFHPDREGNFYERVLVSAKCGSTTLPVWIYWMQNPTDCERVANGKWCDHL